MTATREQLAADIANLMATFEDRHEIPITDLAEDEPSIWGDLCTMRELALMWKEAGAPPPGEDPPIRSGTHQPPEQSYAAWISRCPRAELLNEMRSLWRARHKGADVLIEERDGVVPCRAFTRYMLRICIARLRGVDA